MTKTAPGAGRPVRALSLIGITITGVVAAAVIGAVTNAINGWVSPLYFVTILHWEEVRDVWRATVAQGIFEGLLFGVCFSLLFTAGVGLITRATCSYGFAVGHLVAVVAGALLGWLLGGAAAVGLAALSPEFYRRTFTGVPEEFGPMLNYAWVGGSIWGIELGGLVSTVLGLVVLRGNWLQLQVDRRTSSVQKSG